jgi:hypothetical protein
VGAALWEAAGPGEADFGGVVGEEDFTAAGGDAEVGRAEGSAARGGRRWQDELREVDGGLGDALGLPADTDDIEGRCWRGKLVFTAALGRKLTVVRA